MLNDLIKKRPDVQRAWLEAELDAQIFLADPKNAAEVSKLAESANRADRSQGVVDRALWQNGCRQHGT